MTEPMTDYGQLIERLATMDDPEQRKVAARQLARRLEHAFGQTADVAQVVRWETEEWLRQRVGETNDLISQLASDQRAARGAATAEVAAGFDGLHQAIAAFRAQQEAAVMELRAGFQQIAETVDNMADDVAALKAAGITQEKLNRELVGRQDRIETALGNHAGRLAQLEEYAALLPDAERRRIIALAELNDRRYREIQAQQQEIQSQLAELLARPAAHEADA